MCLAWSWLWCWQVGSWLEEDSFLTIDSCRYMHASRSSTHDIDNACMFGIASKHARKRGVVTITLFIAYSFSCDSFDCVLCENSQFAIKRISHSKPDLRYYIKVHRVTCIPPTFPIPLPPSTIYGGNNQNEFRTLTATCMHA